MWFLIDNGLTGRIISHSTTVSGRSYTYAVYPLVLTATSVSLSACRPLFLSGCLCLSFPYAFWQLLRMCCLSVSHTHIHSCCSSPGWMSVSNHYRCQYVPSTASTETIETSSVPHYCHSTRNIRSHDIPTGFLKCHLHSEKGFPLKFTIYNDYQNNQEHIHAASDFWAE